MFSELNVFAQKTEGTGLKRGMRNGRYRFRGLFVKSNNFHDNDTRPPIHKRPNQTAIKHQLSPTSSQFVASLCTSQQHEDETNLSPDCQWRQQTETWPKRGFLFGSDRGIRGMVFYLYMFRLLKDKDQIWEGIRSDLPLKLQLCIFCSNFTPDIALDLVFFTVIMTTKREAHLSKRDDWSHEGRRGLHRPNRHRAPSYNKGERNLTSIGTQPLSPTLQPLQMLPPLPLE